MSNEFRNIYKKIIKKYLKYICWYTNMNNIYIV